MAFELPALPSFQIQQPDVFGTAAKMMQLRDLMQQNKFRQQLQPLQLQQTQGAIQQQQIETEMKNLQLQGQKALTEYWKRPEDFSSEASDFKHNDALAGMLGIDPSDPLMSTGRAMLKAGVPGPMMISELQNTLKTRQEWSKATQEQQSVLKNAFEQLREIGAPILDEKDANKKQTLLDQALPGLKRWAQFDPSLAAVIPSLHAGNVDAFLNRIGAEEKAMDYAKKTSEASEAAQKVIQPGQTMSPQMKGEAAKSVAVDTDPAVVAAKVKIAKAEAEARQQAAQGDPAVAGQLLANGSLTLKDLKTRGMTPQFIEQATLAAQKLNPGYNPADEVIAEHIAESPGASQFFGSANSLIEKGGTLDKLTELGKKIPQHDFPVLNTIDDWQKAARGKGALAGYAAMALGVADDYGKVMGGGNASDSARDSALNLFAKAASPEQREQAIKATRAAVQSQRDARIGKNQFLKRQYGSGELGGQKPATQQHIADYARAKGISVQQATQEFKDAGYTVQ